ncbi:MAG: sigma-70 family RNA polymerase sigma factor, partial [Firmicutes bacterium]|nr:sigma-70 family RNA polymerase sigma factor [Bacillota bacterium]
LYRIMLNEIYNMLRRQHREPHLSPDEELDDIPDSMQMAKEVAESLTLKEALDCLSPEDKMLVQLRYFEDLKLEQIAEILDENLSTVKSRLYRTLKKLRLHLETE